MSRRSRSSFGHGMLGGIVGGIIGNAIENAAEKPTPAPTPAKPAESKPATPGLEEVLKRVTQVPVGGTVYLKVEEYRVLTDKGLIQYKETVPYCMDRIIEV
jgi:hypothetical protein